MSIADRMIERNYADRERERKKERKWRERNWVDKRCERGDGVNGCMPSAPVEPLQRAAGRVSKITRICA